MALLTTFRQHWRWFIPLLAILPFLVFGSLLIELYYSKVERTGLLKNSSAISCMEYTAVLKDRSPKSCDLALPAVAVGNAVIESYFFSDGSRLVHESRNGQWRSSSTECTAEGRLMWVSIVGFILFGLATLMHSLRTGQWFQLPFMKRAPMSDTEFIIAVYGAAIFCGNLVSLGMTTCSAITFM